VSEATHATPDASELGERLRLVRQRLDEFRGRL
jgi:hypothetical protein